MGYAILFTRYNIGMQGGLTTAGGIKAGLSGLGVLIFQWVPAALLSLTTAANSGSTASSTPLNSAVTLPQVEGYLQGISPPATYEHFITDWGLFAALSIFVSLVLASILIYCVVRLFQVREFEYKRFEAASATISAHDVPRTQLRWDRIIAEINSDSEQNWRLAILEADIMLNELLDTLGYRGETMADKMRAVERADFNTIDLAWEAHRARNRIAHESSETGLNPRDVRHVIDLYQRVFREFQFVA
jgi:hypothetical protein